MFSPLTAEGLSPVSLENYHACLALAGIRLPNGEPAIEQRLRGLSANAGSSIRVQRGSGGSRQPEAESGLPFPSQPLRGG